VHVLSHCEICRSSSALIKNGGCGCAPIATVWRRATSVGPVVIIVPLTNSRNDVLLSVTTLEAQFFPIVAKKEQEFELTLLSLPKDTFYEVEYDSKWIDDELKNQLKNDSNALKDRDAYVIFWDYGKSQFYPIRLCKIQEVQSREPYKFILRIGKLFAFKEPQAHLTFSNMLSTYLKNRGFANQFSPLLSQSRVSPWAVLRLHQR
jgi:hypothetical protein